MKGDWGLLLRRLLSAMVLATGFGVLWLIAVAVLGTIVLEACFRGEPRVRESIVVRSDGQLLIETRRGRAVEGYRDLDGRPFAGPGQPALILPIGLVGAQYQEGIDYFLRSGRVDWNWRLKAFEDDQHASNHWFFVHDGKENGSGYFVGYHWATFERVGFIGDSGFRRNPLPAQQGIPVGRDLLIWSQWSSARMEQDSGQVERERYQIKSRIPSHLVYVPSGNRVRLVDLAQQSVRTVFEGDSPIVGINLINEPAASRPASAQRLAILVRTERSISGLADDHRVIWRLPCSDESMRMRVALIYVLSDGQIVMTIRRGWEGNIMRDRVYWLSPGGVVQKQQDAETQIGDLAWNERSEGLLLAWAVPVPAVFPALQPLVMVLGDMANSYLDAWRLMLEQSWLSLVGVALVTLALATATWWHSKRFALPLHERLVWWVFVALTGVPGFAGYLLHRRWPLRQTCSHCLAMTPLATGACAWCEKRFPGPIPKGTEVFA
ncbi:MAG TPA: hypothetical protein VGP76_12045 [Planctomycetaceae bacterium]|jgi:hypothetical protein|nr:hypothetical protein [Planctomycetaceae bacterium]